MIAHSPISILGTGSISVCDYIHPSRFDINRMETRNRFDESGSWCINTRSYSRRGPVCGIDRKLTMMHLLPKLGAHSLHARTKFADQIVSSAMPIFGNTQGRYNYDSKNKEKEKQNRNM